MYNHPKISMKIREKIISIILFIYFSYRLDDLVPIFSSIYLDVFKGSSLHSSPISSESCPNKDVAHHAFHVAVRY
jgi:hypothetical protein